MRFRIGKKFQGLINWILLKDRPAPIVNYLGAVGFNLLIVSATLGLCLGWALIGSLLPLPEYLFVPFWLTGILSTAALIGIVLKT